MLQIIGWLGCAYLIVKGCELLAIPSRPLSATFGAGIAFVAALGFFVLIQMQVGKSGLNGAASLSNFSSVSDEVENTAIANAVEADAATADAAISAALKEADELLADAAQ